jgi:hypothetical protein
LLFLNRVLSSIGTSHRSDHENVRIDTEVDQGKPQRAAQLRAENNLEHNVSLVLNVLTKPRRWPSRRIGHAGLDRSVHEKHLRTYREQDWIRSRSAVLAMSGGAGGNQTSAAHLARQPQAAAAAPQSTERFVTSREFLIRTFDSWCATMR